ncbi:FmdB family zinc ribbon protein [Kineococcus sp. LSe6-4]|uniref:FmdB family zinc ribbon protein n=1 Tax=Kineococcus halophytocola TaxID=3234027 RepID=A0ABV4H5N6_9ACTN
MTTYAYRCSDHGQFDVHRPLGQAPPGTPCPTCAADCGRVFTAPLLSFGDPAARRLIESTQRSAHEPRVVTSLPPRR